MRIGRSWLMLDAEGFKERGEFALVFAAAISSKVLDFPFCNVFDLFDEIEEGFLDRFRRFVWD
jgi:hypothetical protein